MLLEYIEKKEKKVKSMKREENFGKSLSVRKESKQ